MPSTDTLLLVSMFLGWLVLVDLSFRWDKRRARKLETGARQSGWVTVDPAQVPPEFASHVNWRVPSLVMTRPGVTGPVWFVRHRWTDRGMPCSPHVLGRHDRSRFLAYVPSAYPLPAMKVMRRSLVSGSILSARGVGGSGDGFHREFTLRPPADPSAVAVLHPELRAALLAGALPPFELAGNLAWIDYWDHTTPELIDRRAQVVVALAVLLVAAHE